MELDLWLGMDRVDDIPGLEVRELGDEVLIGLTGSLYPAHLNRSDVKRLYLSLEYWYDLGETS